MGFVTGLSIHGFKNLPASSLVKFASIIDLKHIEFDISVFEDINNVISVFRAKQSAIHAPYMEDYGFDLSSRNSSADSFIENVKKAKNDLVIKGVIIHPPSDSGGSLDLFYDRIEQLPGYCYLENMTYQSWNEFHEFFEMTQSYVSANLAFCFDIPHSYITYGDKYLNIPEIYLNFIKSSNGYIHISGGSRDEDKHLPLLTDGDIPIEQIKDFLSEVNFSGTLMMELAPRSLLEVDKILQSYIMMLGISKERSHQLKVRFKKPFLMRRFRKLYKLIEVKK